MNKKGFTLAEVMGVLVIMAALALMIIPVVDKQLKEGNQTAYESAITSIKSSLDLFMKEFDLQKNESMIITLYQLKYAGYVDEDIKNPVTDEKFANDMLITILNDNGILKYSIDETSGNNKKSFSALPKISFEEFYIPDDVDKPLGKTLEVVELGSSYSPKTKEGLTVSSNVNTNVVGSYSVVYTYDDGSITNKAIKTVVVRDTVGPTVSFDTLNISLINVGKYDFESDITVSDLSGIKSVEVFKNFGALVGTYSVKYVVTDNYGNQTVKYRKVITS